MFAGLSEALDLEGINEVSVPRDWGWNFQDCDLWISLAGPGVGAILPLRPTTHYCADLAQRYVPTAITGTIHDPYWLVETDAFRIWRQGLVLASDDGTAADLVSYAGVRRERIEVVPDVLDQLPSIPSGNEDDRDPCGCFGICAATPSTTLRTAFRLWRHIIVRAAKWTSCWLTMYPPR